MDVRDEQSVTVGIDRAITSLGGIDVLVNNAGIDVNLLLPGGATRSGMTPDSAPEDVQAAWLDPAIMGPPIVWLASRASDGITDQRIVATEFAAR